MAYIDSGKAFDKESHHEKMKDRMESLDLCPYLFRIPSPLYKKVKMKLVNEEKNLREVLIKMLEKYIKE